MQLTAADHAALDAFWAAPPRPMTPINPAHTPGAQTYAITCRACGVRTQILTFVDVLLCMACASDLDATEARVNERLEALKHEEAQVMEVWALAHANLDDTLAARWVTLCADRDRVTAQLERAKRGPYYNWSDAQIAQNIAAKQSAYDEVMTKIARTAQKPGPLAQLLKGYSLWKQSLTTIAQQFAACEQALAEIDCARPGGAPF